MSYTLAISPLLAPILGDDAAARLFSAEADLEAMLRFEVALAEAQSRSGLVTAEAAKQIAIVAQGLSRNSADHAEAIARDAMVVPGLVAALKKAAGPSLEASIHLGSTSQDVIDTSLMLRAKQAISGIVERSKTIENLLSDLEKRFGALPLTARTRMQKALQVTVSNRLALWRIGNAAARTSLASLSFPLQFGGPVGTLEAFGPKGSALKRELALALGLDVLDHCWHTERSPILSIGNACAGVTTALGKIGIDVVLMAQNEFSEVKLQGGGTSSVMHHKQNPVKAEVLVTLARFNASQLSALHAAGVHEQERSGTAWTLEWMVLPQMIVAAAASARLTEELLRSIERFGP
jgi:3-carboxy-cis,cis-muconate cycloisomerase